MWCPAFRWTYSSGLQPVVSAGGLSLALQPADPDLPVLSAPEDDIVLNTVYAGLSFGIGVGLVMRCGASTGAPMRFNSL
ncbi:MAG: YitT family protein [Oscillospiraceae bacterium]|nr:YitT family protein [Oscillospiraceae bacterium]